MPSSVEIRRIRPGPRPQGIYSPDGKYFNKMLLFMLLHLIFPQRGEVRSSIRNRGCETCPESHRKSSPGREAEPKPSNPSVELVSRYNVTCSRKPQRCPDPCTYAACPPNLGCQESFSSLFSHPWVLKYR